MPDSASISTLSGTSDRLQERLERQIWFNSEAIIETTRIVVLEVVFIQRPGKGVTSKSSALSDKVNKDMFLTAEIINDVLKIDTENILDPLNLTRWAVHNSEGLTANMPDECLVGIREMYYFNDNWFVIKITEFLPNIGRIWYRVYDKNHGWGGWVSK